MAGIGRDLLDLPFAELVRNLATAIADGQTALDRNSLETLRTLLDDTVDVVTDVTEIIEVEERVVQVGNGSIVVTGATVRSSGAAPVTMSMVQAGILPTFYQFTEASIDVRISITMREDRTTDENGRTRGAGFLGLGGSKAYASSVDFRSQNKYSYKAQGSSALRATLRPVPPPSRLEPTITTVNMIANPPVVTRTPG
jgi:hypothetical protein